MARLRIADWRDTYATLQLYVQIVGKIRQALTPKINEWWNVTLHATPRGLTTGTMPYARPKGITWHILSKVG
jgi:hypothetical protein